MYQGPPRKNKFSFRSVKIYNNILFIFFLFGEKFSLYLHILTSGSTLCCSAVEHCYFVALQVTWEDLKKVQIPRAKI